MEAGKGSRAARLRGAVMACREVMMCPGERGPEGVEERRKGVDGGTGTRFFAS